LRHLEATHNLINYYVVIYKNIHFKNLKVLLRIHVLSLIKLDEHVKLTG